MLNLREAAELAGTTKSSIWRAIRSGRLSCTKDEFGGVQIDPAEIARVYPPKPPKPERAGSEQSAQSGSDELRMRNAALEAEVRLLREMADRHPRTEKHKVNIMDLDQIGARLAEYHGEAKTGLNDIKGNLREHN